MEQVWGTGFLFTVAIRLLEAVGTRWYLPAFERV